MYAQEILRKKVKLVKVEYDDIYYKDLAEFLQITEHSFYNWLNGYYELSRAKAIKLNDILCDLLPDYL